MGEHGQKGAGEGQAKRHDLKGMEQRAEELADRLREAESATVATHIDADGITAGAIARGALRRLGIEPSMKFYKKLDEAACQEIRSLPSEVVWLTDLGSGYLSQLCRPGLLVCDHHPPEERKRTSLFDFDEGAELHLNPHLFGYDGSSELSGAGAAYLVARAIDPANIDLSVLAIVGAVGDMQDSAQRRLVGANRQVLKDAEASGLVRRTDDLRLFGRETRPIVKFLQYASDPALPGLSGDWAACCNFLRECGVDPRGGRSYSMLKEGERQRIRDGLCAGLDSGIFESINGEVYILANEQEGTELHEAKEYSTLLNSCGRYGNAELGCSICLGSRGDERERALEQLRNHKGFLIDAMSFIFSSAKSNGVCERRQAVQVLKANGSYLLPDKVRMDRDGVVEEREVFRDTTVGIVAGMVLGSGRVDDDVPIIAMMLSDDGKIKVSGRGNQKMIARGLNLSSAMREAAASVGGVGGGHDIAAGASVPIDQVEPFLKRIDAEVARQMAQR